MPRAEKEAEVAALKERIEKSDGTILTEFRGLKVAELKELRIALSESGTEFKVIKNSLGRIAFKDADREGMVPFLEGSTAVAFITGDPVAAAKGLDTFAAKFPALVLKAGFIEGQVLDGERVGELAKIKPREVLLSQFAGMLKQPLTKLAIVIGAPLRDLGYLLAAYQEKLGKESPPLAAEAKTPAETPEPAAETPTEEAPTETEDNADDGGENKEE